MKRRAAKRQTTTSDPVQKEMQQFINAQTAKTQFMSATLNMSWRLLFTVVIPLVAGVKLDERFKSAPSFTLLGIMIAAVAGCVAVWGTVKEVNREQADNDALLKKTKRRMKRV